MGLEGGRDLDERVAVGHVSQQQLDCVDHILGSAKKHILCACVISLSSLKATFTDNFVRL